MLEFEQLASYRRNGGEGEILPMSQLTAPAYPVSKSPRCGEKSIMSYSCGQ